MRKKNAPLTQMAFKWHWNKWAKAACYEGNTRQLRHLFATYCFEAGVAPKDAQAILGHSSIDVTMDVYTEIRADRAHAQKATLDAFFRLEVS